MLCLLALYVSELCAMCDPYYFSFLLLLFLVSCSTVWIKRGTTTTL